MMTAFPSDGPRPPQFTLRSLFVLTAIVCLALSLLMPAIHTARDAQRRLQCSVSLSQIGLSLHSYHDLIRCFPLAYIPGPQGQPLTTWRVKITPFLDNSGPFYKSYRFEESWNSPNNIQLSYWHEGCYHCPADSSPRPLSSYLAVVGPETAWPAPKCSQLKDCVKGLSNTILTAELNGSGIHWMEPRDLKFEQLNFTIGRPSSGNVSNGPSPALQSLSSEHSGGANVLLTDGSTRFLGIDTSPEVLREMLVIRKNPGETSAEAETPKDASGKQPAGGQHP